MPSADGVVPGRRTELLLVASASLPDGTTFQGPVELRELLLNRRQEFVATVTQKTPHLRRRTWDRVL